MTSMLAAGNSTDSVIFAGATDSTSAVTFDALYVDSSLSCANSTQTWRQLFIDTTGGIISVGSGSTVYAHVEYTLTGSTNTLFNAWYLGDAAGNPWLALRSATTASVLFGLFYNSGTVGAPVWTQLGASFSLTASVRRTMDLKVTIGSPHIVELSVNGVVQVAATTFTQALFTNAGHYGGTGNTSGSTSAGLQSFFSQMMATDGLSTINGHVFSRAATGAGATSGWTGAASDINEVVLNDTTGITAATNGLVSTFVYADITLPAGYYIPSVFLYSRFKNSGVAPNNFQAAYHSSAGDFFSGNLPGVGTSFLNAGYQWALEPGGAVPWTQTLFNAAEFGGKAIT